MARWSLTRTSLFTVHVLTITTSSNAECTNHLLLHFCGNLRAHLFETAFRILRKCHTRRRVARTKSSAVAERPRDALCH